MIETKISNILKEFKYVPSNDEVRDLYHGFGFEKEAEEIISYLDQNRPILESRIQINGSQIREKQIDAASYIVTQKKGILADEAGAGKTYPAILASQLIESIEGKCKTLIVCPGFLKPHWENKFNEYLLSDKKIKIISAQKNWKKQIAEINGEDVVIINYALLRSCYKGSGKGKTELIPEAKALEDNFDYVIIDESHNISNASAEQSKAVEDIAGKIKYAALLTATPIPNTPKDFENQRKIVNPEGEDDGNTLISLLYKSTAKAKEMILSNVHLPLQSTREILEADDLFLNEGGPLVKYSRVEMETEQRYIYDKILEHNADVTVKLMAARKAALDPYLLFFSNVNPKENENGGNEKTLRAFIGDLFDLKEISDKKTLEEMSQEGKSDVFIEKELKKIAKKSKKDTLVKAGTDLYLIVDGEIEEVRIAKYDELKKRLENGDKSVIFSEFKNGLMERVGRMLEKEGINYLTLSADDGEEEKERKRKLFQVEPEIKVLLGTTPTMREGIDLTSANKTYFLDLPYYPGPLVQAVGRTYRPGQSKNVEACALVNENTLDEGIYLHLTRKLTVIDKIMKTENLDGSEIRDFISTPKDIIQTYLTTDKSKRTLLILGQLLKLSKDGLLSKSSLEEEVFLGKSLGAVFAELYDETIAKGYSANVMRGVRNLIEDNVEEDLEKILDLACGPATTSKIFEKPITGVDMCKYWKSYVEAINPDNEFINKKVQNLPKNLKNYDLAVFSLGLHWIGTNTEKKKVFSNINSALRDGGYVAITLPDAYATTKNNVQLQEALEASGFKVLDGCIGILRSDENKGFRAYVALAQKVGEPTRAKSSLFEIKERQRYNKIAVKGKKKKKKPLFTPIRYLGKEGQILSDFYLEDSLDEALEMLFKLKKKDLSQLDRDQAKIVLEDICEVSTFVPDEQYYQKLEPIWEELWKIASQNKMLEKIIEGCSEEVQEVLLENRELLENYQGSSQTIGIKVDEKIKKEFKEAVSRISIENILQDYITQNQNSQKPQPLGGFLKRKSKKGGCGKWLYNRVGSIKTIFDYLTNDLNQDKDLVEKARRIDSGEQPTENILKDYITQNQNSQSLQQFGGFLHKKSKEGENRAWLYQRAGSNIETIFDYLTNDLNQNKDLVEKTRRIDSGEQATENILQDYITQNQNSQKPQPLGGFLKRKSKKGESRTWLYPRAGRNIETIFDYLTNDLNQNKDLVEKVKRIDSGEQATENILQDYITQNQDSQKPQPLGGFLKRKSKKGGCGKWLYQRAGSNIETIFDYLTNDLNQDKDLVEKVKRIDSGEQATENILQDYITQNQDSQKSQSFSSFLITRKSKKGERRVWLYRRAGSNIETIFDYLTNDLNQNKDLVEKVKKINKRKDSLELKQEFAEEKFKEYLKREDVVALLQGMDGELRNILGSYIIDVFLQEHRFVIKDSLTQYLGEVNKLEGGSYEGDVDGVLRLLNAFYQLDHVEKGNLDNVMFAALNQFYDGVCDRNESDILERISEDKLKQENLAGVYGKLEGHYQTRAVARSLLGTKIVKEVKVVDVV